ncbi:MAG: DUF418 domain-containing protein [Bacteroidota bacterium]
MTQSKHQNPKDTHQPTPVEGKQRYNSLDVLRGVAVLAIFAVNIKMMANGFNHYRDISLWTGESAQTIGLIHSRLIDGKFLTIFTALFGAGLALLIDRKKPVPLATVLRRLSWLILFAVIHLIFIREGDILIWYALAGFLAIPFAKLPARLLFIIGIGLQVAVFIHYTYVPISDMEPILWSTASDAHEEVSHIMLGTVGGQIAARIEAARYYMIDLFAFGGVWIDTLGTMLLGMALLKNGFLSGKLPMKRYILWAIAGLALASAYYLLRPFLDIEDKFQGLMRSILGYAHRFGGAIVWSALIVGAVSAGWKGRWLSAVGRTAFTVYIMQSVIGLLLFSSLGLGWFGQLSLLQLMITTLLTWVFFLCAAPLWLRYFRFGPLEWAWRSLTYRKIQPFRR